MAVTRLFVVVLSLVILSALQRTAIARTPKVFTARWVVEEKFFNPDCRKNRKTVVGEPVCQWKCPQDEELGFLTLGYKNDMPSFLQQAVGVQRLSYDATFVQSHQLVICAWAAEDVVA